MFSLGVLDGGGLGEESDGALARLVGGDAVPAADKPGERRYVDDGAAAGVAQGGYRCLGAEEYALGVDIEDGVPLLRGGVL